MEDDATLKLFAAVFGTDSDSDHSVDPECDDQEPRPRHSNFALWQPVEGVDGLWRCEQFLDAAEQGRLVEAIEREGWFHQPSRHNQAMRFGVLPGWAEGLSSSIFASISRFRGLGLGLEVPLEAPILARTPLFDQMIVNLYQPGEGIGAHVDLARFEDGIVVLSLLSSCVMRFRRCERPGEIVDVLLDPGDLIALSGNARYGWTHEIDRERAEEQAWAGTVLEQARRISVTLRRLCPEENVQIPMESINRKGENSLLAKYRGRWWTYPLRVAQVIVNWLFMFNLRNLFIWLEGYVMGFAMVFITEKSVTKR